MIRTRIKKELLDRKWSMLKLSHETGIRHPTITRFLKGDKGLHTDYLETIFKILKIDL